jgi:alpha-galactosidase
MQQHIVLIGAGSANFGLGTLGDVLKSKAFEGSKITLHDINPVALQRVYEIGQHHIEKHHLPFELKATTDRKEALQGATICVISIEVGNRFELWDQDWKIPLQYGIRQVYGENGGPGGLFHSLRIIPPILDICADIMSICPEAQVFNFSNPMSRICTTVKRKFPELKLTGLCHEIASLPEHLPRLLNTPLSNLSFRAGGLNHFSCLLQIHYKDTGSDAYADVRTKAPAYFESVPHDFFWALEGSDDADLRKSFNRQAMWVERKLFQVILKEFDLLPITTDSHFGEYIQWAQDVVDHRGILDFYRAYEFWCAHQITPERVEGTDEGWTIKTILEGILTNSGHEELAVNVMNDGLIDNLPNDIVVEVPAIISQDGVRGVRLGKLPKAFGGLLNNQYAVHDLTAEAVLTGSKKAVLQAMLVDPVGHSVNAAEETLDTMLTTQAKYLYYLK